MKTVYIRMLDGTIKEFPEGNLIVPPSFYKSGMCKVVTTDMTYLMHSSNVAIITDDEYEVMGDAY